MSEPTDLERLTAALNNGLFGLHLHSRPNEDGTGGLVCPPMGPPLAIVATKPLAAVFAEAPALLAMAIELAQGLPEDAPLPDALARLVAALPQDGEAVAL